jgi:hypothetical protein
MFWEGCSEAQSLGVEPSGLMTLFSLRTPTQLKPSASFEIHIWKDKERTQKIAQLEYGAVVTVDQLETGSIDMDTMSIEASDPYIQRENSIIV